MNLKNLKFILIGLLLALSACKDCETLSTHRGYNVSGVESFLDYEISLTDIEGNPVLADWDPAIYFQTTQLDWIFEQINIKLELERNHGYGLTEAEENRLFGYFHSQICLPQDEEEADLDCTDVNSSERFEFVVSCPPYPLQEGDLCEASISNIIFEITAPPILEEHRLFANIQMTIQVNTHFYPASKMEICQ